MVHQNLLDIEIQIGLEISFASFKETWDDEHFRCTVQMFTVLENVFIVF